MQSIFDRPAKHNNSEEREACNRLRRVRHQAAKSDLAIVTSFGALTVITTALDRPRSINGLVGVSLEEIERALPMPVRKGPRPIGDDDLDRMIRRVGPDRVLARLDHLTAPTQPGQAIATE
jgi:hypothetical protein